MSASQANQRPGRLGDARAAKLPALDGLRGIAIIMVVATHVGGGWQAAQSIFADTQHGGLTFAISPLLGLVIGQCIQGVTLFFVVSAFTLTLSLGNRPQDLGGYALRRVARVGPAYWLAGFFYLAIAGFAPRLWAPDGIAPIDLLIAAGFGSAWQAGASLAVVPGGWSVSCEVAFYVALPVLIWLVRGLVWRAALLTLVSAAGIEWLAHHDVFIAGWRFAPIYFNPLVQLPVFMCGITAALIWRTARIPRAPILALLLLAACVVVLPFLPIWLPRLTPHIPFAAMATVVVILVAAHPPALLTMPPLRRLGEVSFSLYLIHFAMLAPSLHIAEFLCPADDWHTLAAHFTITAATSFALARASHRLVEQPAIRWASQFRPRALGSDGWLRASRKGGALPRTPPGAKPLDLDTREGCSAEGG